MKKIVTITIILLNIALSSNIFGQNHAWLDEINGLANDETISDDSLYTILTHWNSYPAPDSTGVFNIYYNQINDTLSAPYVLYVPPNYDPQKKTPMIVYLHGGVSTKVFYPLEDGYPKKVPFVPFAAENTWLDRKSVV